MKNIRKNRMATLLLAVLVLGFCSACSKKAAVSVRPDGCISPLSWGMSAEKAKKTLSDYKIQYSMTVSQEGREVLRFETSLLDAPATVDLKFNSSWPESVATGMYLHEITVMFEQADMTRIAEQLKAVWGEQATKMPVYVSSDGDERVEMRDMASQNGRCVWRTEKSLLDEFDENKLIEVFSLSQEELNEKSLVKRLYDSSLYIATLQQLENGSCYLEVNGYYSALIELQR